ILILLARWTKGVVNLIQEKGFKDDTFFYHLGDNGHAYHYNSAYKNSIYFKCMKYDQLQCKGRAILKDKGAAFIHTKPHNHPPNPDLVQERAIHRAILKDCRELKWVSYRQILDTHRSDRRYRRRVRARMTMPRLRSSMRKARLDTYPEIPPTLEELTIELMDDSNGHIIHTEGDDSIYAGSVTASDGSHHLIFMSNEQKWLLGEVRVIHADGTFKSRPASPASSQLFCIVTTWETYPSQKWMVESTSNQRRLVIPLCWVLMERRTLAAYRAVFSFLRDQTNLNPRKIITDFEYSQQRAWRLEFPGAEIQGC
ncbi:FLYWCH-type zinc finger-containing protein 1, partial [Frankliniella fusca]